jgi:F-box protein 9
MEDTNPELESFREQWRAEVSARAREVPKSNAGPLKTFRRPPPITSLSSSRVLKTVKEDDDYVDTQMVLAVWKPSMANPPREPARNQKQHWSITRKR